jgi:hypothetical protein
MSAEVIIGKIVSLAFSAIDRAQGNSAEGQKLKADLERLSMEARAKLREAQRDIIVAEAKGESWLQRNWRPMTMLFFTGLIGAYWMGFAAPNLPVEAINGLFDVVYIGLGGYVIGRSAEKIVTNEAHMLTPAPLPKQDPADAPYHFCALASLCDDGPRPPKEG